MTVIETCRPLYCLQYPVAVKQNAVANKRYIIAIKKNLTIA